MKPSIHVQAHRGASAEAYENTLECIQRAIEVGAHSVECDLHRLKDGNFVVFHDFILKPERAFNLPKEVFISDLNWEELQNIQWREKRLKIPLLKELLLQLKSVKAVSGFWMDFELKYDVRNLQSPQRVDIISGFQACMSESWDWKKTAVRSFDWPLLEMLGKNMPKSLRIPLVGPHTSDFEGAKKVSSGWIAPAKEMMNPSVVKSLHQAGLKIMAYTANSMSDWQDLIQMGVDGITTDDPRKLLDYLNH